MEWVPNLVDAKIVIESWRRHYNEVRPHSSIGDLTQAECKIVPRGVAYES